MSAEVRFCVRCATPVERKLLFGLLRPYCPACGWIFFEDPKVAAAILVEQEDRVLLVRRGIEPHIGDWTIPAGFVNAYEDPARAAERECLEETGLQAKVTELLHVIAGREHPRGADIVIAYRAVVTGGTLLAGDDATDAAFFSRDALPKIAFTATRIVLGLPAG